MSRCNCVGTSIDPECALHTRIGPSSDGREKRLYPTVKELQELEEFLKKHPHIRKATRWKR